MDAAAEYPSDEFALVRKARLGSHAAFALLYQRHARAVYALAYRLTNDTHLAEDITQDVFMRMAQFLGGFRDDTPLRPWLKKVAANAAIDLLRKRRAHLMSEWDAVSEPGDASDAPDDHDLADQLRRLPPLARTLVWLHQVEGWSHQELAERFGMSPSWSKSIVSRALTKLRQGVETHEHDNT